MRNEEEFKGLWLEKVVGKTLEKAIANG